MGGGCRNELLDSRKVRLKTDAVREGNSGEGMCVGGVVVGDAIPNVRYLAEGQRGVGIGEGARVSNMRVEVEPMESGEGGARELLRE